MFQKLYAAIDLGATSGRIILGNRETAPLEVCRFTTPMLKTSEGIYWDFPLLFENIVKGLQKLGDYEIISVGCDSWAQDFGLLTEAGELIANPFSYRDKGSAIDSASRLEYIRQKFPGRLEKAETLLHIADLVNFFLCGARRSNYTLAAMSRLELDHPLLAPLADGEIIGYINHPELKNLQGVPVVSGASHDTASAYAGGNVKENEILLSLGTWLMAAEPWPDDMLPPEGFRILPLLGRKAARYRGGMGLWPFQECVKLWQARGEFPGYARLDADAEKCVLEGAIDPDTPELFSPENMEEAVFALAGKKLLPHETTALLLRGTARRTGQTVAAFGKNFSRAVLVGGASQSGYLCRLLEKELPCPLVPGYSEAAAAGNILIQQELVR